MLESLQKKTKKKFTVGLRKPHSGSATVGIVAHAAEKKVRGHVATSSPLHRIPVWDLGGQIMGHLYE